MCGGTGDYIIWLGEGVEQQNPDLNWDQVMEIVTTTPEKELGERYGLYLQDFLKERG